MCFPCRYRHDAVEARPTARLVTKDANPVTLKRPATCPSSLSAAGADRSSFPMERFALVSAAALRIHENQGTSRRDRGRTWRSATHSCHDDGGVVPKSGRAFRHSLVVTKRVQIDHGMAGAATRVRRRESEALMPKGPRGEKRPADVIGNAVKVIETLPLFRAAGQRRAGQLRSRFHDANSAPPWRGFSLTL
jgi:hypothetical protein